MHPWLKAFLSFLSGVVLLIIGILLYQWLEDWQIEIERRGNMTLCEREVDDMKRAHRYTTRDCRREAIERWNNMSPAEKARAENVRRYVDQ